MDQIIKKYHTTEAIEIDLPYLNSKGLKLTLIFKENDIYICIFERIENNG